MLKVFVLPRFVHFFSLLNVDKNNSSFTNWQSSVFSKIQLNENDVWVSFFFNFFFIYFFTFSILTNKTKWNLLFWHFYLIFFLIWILTNKVPRLNKNDLWVLSKPLVITFPSWKIIMKFDNKCFSSPNETIISLATNDEIKMYHFCCRNNNERELHHFCWSRYEEIMLK